MAENGCVVPNAIELEPGLTVIDTRVGVMPAPLSATVCGLLLAESVKVRVPVRVPFACGENVTATWQLEPADRLEPHPELTLKSLALLVIERSVMDVLWLLVRLTDCGALVVPIAWLPNESAVGFTVADNTPVPVSATVGLLLALVLIVRLPERTPAAVGANVTFSLHVLPAARVEGVRGQPVVLVKSATLEAMERMVSAEL